MKTPGGDRIFGVETEFGTLVADPELGSPEAAVEAIKDYIFTEMKLGALDLVARDDVFEPAESGGFLMNGARLYIDAVGSHLEYATAECRELKDLVANDRAGQRQIVRAIKELGLSDVISVYNNSVDHFGGHTFGCHENYMIRADEDFLTQASTMLYPFLVTRQIYAGVGRVGGHILAAGGGRPNYEEMMANPIDYIWVSHIYDVIPDNSVEFQLSQRADHIIRTLASRVRFNRALINPKWEHFYSYGGYTRLHLLFGEPNQNEYAYALKIGTTLLALRLVEDGLMPQHLMLANPLMDLRSVSRDQDYKWIVKLSSGQTIRSVDLHRLYLMEANRYRGETAQTDWILNEWERTLNDLEKDPLAMGDRLDWVAKRQMVEAYKHEEGLDWTDDALHSVDLEYHNIDPSQSLFHAKQQMGETERYVGEADILTAMTDPPQNTRAKGRSYWVEEVLKRKGRKQYHFDWSHVTVDARTYVNLEDPFDVDGKLYTSDGK